jgi:hypothetical protein
MKPLVTFAWLMTLAGCTQLIDTGGKPCRVSGDCLESLQLCNPETGWCEDPGPKVLDCSEQPDFILCENDQTTPDLWYDICLDGQCISPGSCAPDDTACNVSGPHFRLPPDRDHDALDLVTSSDAVLDRVTGLMWQLCTAGTSPPECASGIAEPFPFADALVYCDDLDLAGHQDWYLPDRFELQSIVDYGQASPAIDEAVFAHTPSAAFWTSSTGADSTAAEPTGWVVHFLDGRMNRQGKVFDGYVRCVRRGP